MKSLLIATCQGTSRRAPLRGSMDRLPHLRYLLFGSHVFLAVGYLFWAKTSYPNGILTANCFLPETVRDRL